MLVASRPDLREMITREGPAKFYRRLCGLLNEKKLTVEDVDYHELAEACGVLGHLRGISRNLSESHVEALLGESGSGPNSALFAVVVGELVGRMVIEGYESDDGWIGDQLVTVQKMPSRGQRLAGTTALGGGLEVNESAPYEETTFEEKHVTSKEAKIGRILSLPEELFAFGMSGEINRRARAMGYYVRQTKERTIVRGVIDADASTNPVYRPSGAGETLYATDGSNQNYIGVGGVAGYNAAVPLTGHDDLDTVLKYRATQVKDDRTDGDPLPIVSRVRQLLTPESLAATGKAIVNATEIRQEDGTTTRIKKNHFSNVQHLSSPFIDAEGGQNVNDWYVGDFRKQFVWSELWPVQTFLQRGDGPAAFERDIALRVKVRYYGGISAVDTKHVTKIDGN